LRHAKVPPAARAFLCRRQPASHLLHLSSSRTEDQRGKEWIPDFAARIFGSGMIVLKQKGEPHPIPSRWGSIRTTRTLEHAERRP